VVETPSDLLSIEATGLYTGLYHVLLGHLSPLDGVGPNQLGLDLLEDRVKSGQVGEVILATSSTVEGEATAHYIAQQMKAMNITVSSLARGVPMGGELDYVDSSTLAHAFKGRRPLE
jgi:recombination protein RecR